MTRHTSYVRWTTPNYADAIAQPDSVVWKIAFRGVMPDNFLDTYEGNPVQRHATRCLQQRSLPLVKATVFI